MSQGKINLLASYHRYRRLSMLKMVLLVAGLVTWSAALLLFHRGLVADMSAAANLLVENRQLQGQQWESVVQAANKAEEYWQQHAMAQKAASPFGKILHSCTAAAPPQITLQGVELTQPGVIIVRGFSQTIEGYLAYYRCLVESPDFQQVFLEQGTKQVISEDLPAEEGYLFVIRAEYSKEQKKQ